MVYMEMNIDTFKEVTKAIGTMFTEAVITATTDGVRINMLDASKVTLVDIDLPGSAMFDYRAAGGDEGEEEYILDVNALVSVSKRAPKKCKRVVIDISDDGVVIRYDSVVKKEFKMATLAPLYDSKKRVLSDRFDATFYINGDVLADIIKDVHSTSGLLEIKVDSRVVSVRGSGVPLEFEAVVDSMDFYGGDDDDAEPAVRIAPVVGEFVAAKFSSSYMAEIAKAIPKGRDVRIDMTTDKPIKITYSLTDGGTCSFVVAPRVERMRHNN